jgi:hypothetical protein
MPRGESGGAEGRWVRIHRVELEPAERSPSVPEDTAAVPFELWINGWLHRDAQLGERVRIRTMSGRTEEGTLVELDPGYWHTFGSPPEPLRRAGGRAFELICEVADS